MDSIGRYRLERRIGAGSFATVWLGHDDDLDVPVAVKVLAENWADNADVRNRFLAEARILRRIRDPPAGAGLRHRHAGRRAALLRHGLHRRRLDERPAQGRASNRSAALRLSAEACRAIEVLHENDIIHRDVTPGNLLLSSTPATARPGC